MPTQTRSRAPKLDAACVAAVEIARAAAEATGPGEVGEHLGFDGEQERVLTHRFACANPGYRGWCWAVTVVRAARAKDVTVDEVVLLAGDDAVLAPVWVPWADRLRPGDIGPGDLLPTSASDDRLTPGYTGALADSFDPSEQGPDGEPGMIVAELGLGRARVLSTLGRADATDRWYSGERGPESPVALAAPGQCSTCGFLLPMGGSLGRVFGACANEYAADDGRVVSFDHGCGGHSELVAAPAALAERQDPVIDHLDYDLIQSKSDEPSGSVESS